MRLEPVLDPFDAQVSDIAEGWAKGRADEGMQETRRTGRGADTISAVACVREEIPRHSHLETPAR
jgi:hypothetical protein